MNANRAIVLMTALCLAGVGLFVALYWHPPGAAAGPEQPIPFSHNVHSGVKQIQCQYCHPYVAYSNFPGIPPVEKCLHCHKYIIVQHPWIQKEHEYFNQGVPTPWVKVNYVAEHVLFNHQRHVNSRISCQQCHGAVQEQHRLPAKQWRMGECVACHKQKGANLDCWLACHS